MGVAGFTEKVYARTDTTAPTSTDLVDGITEFTLSAPVNLLETTQFRGNEGFRSRIAGLKDSSISMSGNYVSGDTVQKLLRAARLSGATVHVTVIVDPNGATNEKGYRVPCLVESYEAGGSVDGLATFSCTLQGNGAVVAV